MITIWTPNPVTMIPVYVGFKTLGWVNSFLPLIVPAFLGSPFYIFLLRQFFLTLPPELEDAARVDGANVLQIIWHVILPISKPALATVAIFTFQASWNDFLAPLIYLHDQSKYTDHRILSRPEIVHRGHHANKHEELTVMENPC